MPTLDTFQAIVGDVHAHALGVDSLLIEGWVRDVWSEIERLRTWSHLRRSYQIVVPAPYAVGTATFTPGSQTVTIATGVVSEGHVGRQLQRAQGEPIHDILAADTGANTYTIFPAWHTTDAVVSAQGYKVFTAYIGVPSDFFAWVSVRDTERRRRLNIHTTQDMLDLYDPKRSIGSRPSCVSGIDWSRSYSGRVYSTLRVTLAGASPTPVAGGSYNGQYDALLVLRIIGTGAVDTATFSYAIDGGTAITQTVSSAGNDLPMGVGLTWPAGTYTSGTVYIVRLSTNPVLGSPRYELYPHPNEAMVLSAVYSTKGTDIEADGWTVPMPITGDVIKLGALDLMARYPGTREKPNPFAQIGRATEFRDRFEEAVMQFMTMDEYIIEQNITQMEASWPYAILPWARSQTDDVLGAML
jgi:hypothetical protein